MQKGLAGALGCCEEETCLQVGGFLSFNVLFPSERPDIPRLMG